MIFYFSGTGNTAWAAETIAQALNDKLVFIPDYIDGHFSLAPEPHEAIGFCFPVHGWRPPIVVRRFIQHLVVKGAAEYVYSVCTAGDTIGETADYLRHDLQAGGPAFECGFLADYARVVRGIAFHGRRQEGERTGQEAAGCAGFTAVYPYYKETAEPCFHAP